MRRGPQVRRLLDHLPGRRIELGEQAIHLPGVERIDVHVELLRLGEEFRILHSRREGADQRGLAVLRQAGRRGEWAGHLLAGEQKLQDLLQEAQAAGKPEEVPPKLMKLRQEHAAKIEALLTETQRKRWQQLLGPPFDLRD